MTRRPLYLVLAILGALVLTSCSGLQAVAFWALRADFDFAWWLPNLFLLIYPLFFIPRLLCSETFRRTRDVAV